MIPQINGLLGFLSSMLLIRRGEKGLFLELTFPISDRSFYNFRAGRISFDSETWFDGFWGNYIEKIFRQVTTYLILINGPNAVTGVICNSSHEVSFKSAPINLIGYFRNTWKYKSWIYAVWDFSHTLLVRRPVSLLDSVFSFDSLIYLVSKPENKLDRSLNQASFLSFSSFFLFFLIPFLPFSQAYTYDPVS